MMMTGGGGGSTTGGGTATGGGSATGGGGGSTTSGSGFVTATHGFSFENYTNDGVTNLTPAEVQRMFGDGACASIINGACTLTPAASEWMDQANAMMNGGHCFGFSHFALNLFKGAKNPSDFGGPNANALQKSNVLVQREIAYWMATQLTAPANKNLEPATRPTPTALLTDLATLWGRGEVATLAFFNRMGAGGHAVTPISIRSRMDGKQELVVYDNNFPNMDRVVVVDPATDSWSYSAAINPSEPESSYDGDATTKSLFMVPIRDAQGVQQCPFCGDYSTATAMSGERTVGMEGGGDLMIDDGQGHQVGTVGKAVTNTFPGARVNAPLSADLYRDDTEPQYVIPGGSPLTVTLDGAQLAARATSSVSVVGPGYSLSVEDLALDVGQQDRLQVSADGQTVTYVASGMESPSVYNAFSTAGDDFEVAATVASDADGAAFSIERAGTSIRVRFVGAGNTAFGLLISKLTQTGVVSFLHTGEALAGDATLLFDVGDWPGQGMALSVDVDHGSDGSVDETLMLTDQD